MKKVLIISTIVALLVGTIGISAFAAGGGKGQFFKAKGGFFQALNLTPDQQSKILAIQQDFQKETLNLRQEMQKKHLELRQLWNADQLNQNAIDAKTKEVNGLKIQMMEKSKVMLEKVKKVLTAEQLKQLESQGIKAGPGFGGRGLGRMRGGMGGLMFCPLGV